MPAVRAAAVSGSFYSNNGQELAETVDEMLNLAPDTGPVPKVIVAPHAGHVYSGPIAASAYRRLTARRDEITRVVLLGPSHRVGFKGIAATSATSYSTPLGEIPLAAQAIQSIISLPETGFLDEAHAQEHSLEVHLPFLQRILKSFQLVPLVVGEASKEAVARVIDALWGGPETLIVVSTDLSHYKGYADAQETDAETSRQIVALNDELTGEQACGCRPLNGLIHLVRQKGLTIEQIDLRNSGDIAGDRDRVVGYGAYIILETAQTDSYSLALRQRMLQVAREAILAPLTGTSNYEVNLQRYPAALQAERASFVTLNIDSRLRGCIGSLLAHQPLIADIASNAQSAAFKDPRFRPLNLEEYHRLEIHISVLTVPERLDVESRAELLEQLHPGVDGLILEENGKRATYLPSVWEQLPDPESFISELRRKAGLPAHTWDDTIVQRYRTEEFS